MCRKLSPPGLLVQMMASGWGWRRPGSAGPPPRGTPAGPGSTPLAMSLPPFDAILPPLHLAATLFMTGVIVFVQVVHYPLMAGVGAEGYRSYQEGHMRRTSWVVLPAMALELAAAVGLALDRSGSTDQGMALVGLALLLVIWLSTAVLQAPLHGRLVSGFDALLHTRLVRTNWIRTVAWGVRVPVALALL